MPKAGDTFLLHYVIIRPLEAREIVNGVEIQNYFCNKFWAEPIRGGGQKILVWFDGEFDPLLQAAEEINIAAEIVSVKKQIDGNTRCEVKVQ